MPPLHRQKRPYAGQATITSFFQPASDSTSSPSEHTTQRSLSPALPPSIQSNLLSVGMRVRKSVPEGYKTGSYSAFTLFNDNATQPVPEKRKEEAQRSIRPVVYGGARRELAPFCGLMKIGGMAVQEQGAGEDWWMCGSQESTASTISEGSVMGGGKRRFEDEEEEEEEEDEDEDEEEEMMFMERKLAVPKSKLSKGKKDRENMGLEDFEEAEFLDPRWRGVEMDEV